MQLGTTYAAPTFGGVSGAASTDPGGLFGWLIYARNTFYSPAKETTGDTYLVYTNPQDLVGDLNKLSGVTACLISAPSVGATYGFFVTAGTVNSVIQLSPQTRPRTSCMQSTIWPTAELWSSQEARLA